MSNEETPPYLRQAKTNHLYVYHPLLAERADMAPWHGKGVMRDGHLVADDGRPEESQRIKPTRPSANPGTETPLPVDQQSDAPASKADDLPGSLLNLNKAQLIELGTARGLDFDITMTRDAMILALKAA